jgi:hypothetical protein
MIRAHRNVAVAAFANKLARVAWSVLRRGERFAAAGMPRAAERFCSIALEAASDPRYLREGDDEIA